MKPIIKTNVYETQAILYWILGNLILPHSQVLGWLAIDYGWLTFGAAIYISGKIKKGE